MSEQQALYGNLKQNLRDHGMGAVVTGTRSVFPGEDPESDIITTLPGCCLTQWTRDGVFYAMATYNLQPPYSAKHHTRAGAIRLVAELMREAGVL